MHKTLFAIEKHCSMIQYRLSCASPTSQNLQIKVSFEAFKAESSVKLLLPAWRPGRYEFQHFARNIFNLVAKTEAGEIISVQKTGRNEWELINVPTGKISVDYQYSCTQLDAGGSWIDDELIYINPINCFFYIEGRIDEACSINIKGLSDKIPACALPFKNGLAQCNSFYEIADSPFFISNKQKHDSYEVQGREFHIWTHGEITYDATLLKDQFKAFTEVQINAMGEFPEPEYHFLLLLFPFRCYHGVEHRDSTVITLGPSQELSSPDLYNELISISSHELYHAWNICKIRPQEMLPYRFQEENYFHTGFIAEGITSYLGEYFLRESSFFSEEQFLLEIEQWMNRHENNKGLTRANLRESSIDLWVDGYSTTSSDYKMSIYVAGALSAIAMDLLIRSQNKNKSIHDFMRRLYIDLAKHKKGYTEEILQTILSDFIGKKICLEFWDKCIAGHELILYVTNLLKNFGVVLASNPSAYRHERVFGIKLKPVSSKIEIAKIKIDAPSALFLMADDLITAIDGIHISNAEGLESQLNGKTQAVFHVLRKGRELQLEVSSNAANYWNTIQVKKNSEASDEQKLRYKDWIG